MMVDSTLLKYLAVNVMILIYDVYIMAKPNDLVIGVQFASILLLVVLAFLEMYLINTDNNILEMNRCFCLAFLVTAVLGVLLSVLAAILLIITII